MSALVRTPPRAPLRSLAKLDHRQAPIVEALAAGRSSRATPFHTPGHKHGAGADPELRDLLGADLFANDTWLNTGDFARTLREAEALVADAWDAERTHLLVNGSSSGNQAAMLALLRPGDEVIVGRDMHRSLLAGLILSGARPVYVAPRLDPVLGVSLGVAPVDVAAALAAHPAARLIAVVSPSYYGIAPDLRAIVRVAHEHDVPVYIDEAWGAHFPFHPLLPTAALQAGADIAVTSAHKTLGCLSQGALLHVQGERVDRARLAATVAMTQTTSPLLPILASIDSARRQMALDGEALLERTIELALQARQRLRALPGIAVVEPARESCHAIDLTRLVIDVRGIGLTGYQAERLLRAEHGIAPEMSDLVSIVCLVTIGDRQTSIDRLVAAIAALAIAGNGRRCPARLDERSLGAVVSSGIPQMSPAEAFHGPTRTVTLENAIGQVSAEMIVPYPPGIPVILPGELVTGSKVAYLRHGQSQGMTLSGASDPTLASVRVVA